MFSENMSGDCLVSDAGQPLCLGLVCAACVKSLFLMPGVEMCSGSQEVESNGKSFMSLFFSGVFLYAEAPSALFPSLVQTRDSSPKGCRR